LNKLCSDIKKNTTIEKQNNLSAVVWIRGKKKISWSKFHPLFRIQLLWQQPD